MSRIVPAISRRSVLRSALATLALPVLPSLLPRTARAQEAPPVRLVFLYVPNGIQMDWWTPSQEGDTWDLTEILSPLANVKSVGSSRVDLQACKLEYSIVSPK